MIYSTTPTNLVPVLPAQSQPVSNKPGLSGDGISRAREEHEIASPEALVNTYEIRFHNDKTGVLKRYFLQEAMRDILPFSRLRVCCRHIVPVENASPTVKVLYNEKYKRAHYGGLMVCGSVWICALCAAKVSERRKIELVQGTKNHAGGLGLVMFNIRHHKNQNLFTSITQLERAYKLLTHGRWWQDFKTRWGVCGFAANYEVTWGEANGWHPHKHILYFFNDKMTDEKIEKIRVELTDKYLKLLEKVGGSGLDRVAVHCQNVKTESQRVAEYVTKWDKDPAKTPWGIEAEIAKSPVKKGHGGHYSIWQLVELYMTTGDIEIKELIEEYFVVMKGRRALSFSQGLRDRLNIGPEKTDEEVASAPEENSIEMWKISQELWAIIKREKLRGQVLHVANSGDTKQLINYLDSIVEKENDCNRFLTDANCKPLSPGRPLKSISTK